MNFVYLSPHFPRNYQAFSVQLRKLGATVLGLADEPCEMLDPKLRQALTEYYQVCNMHDYNQLLSACGYFTHHYGKIDRIDSHLEYWLETEAQLRTDFNIQGIKNDTIRAIKHKSQMKLVFMEAGIAVAKGNVCHSLSEVLKLVDETGFPIVAKPDIGVGATATYKFNNYAELKNFFTDKPPIEYIFEEFISGDLCSFDGLTDQDGNPCFFTSHGFSQGIMETVQSNSHIYYYSLREVPPDLENIGRRVLKAFNVKERFFHFEFFRSHKNGQLIALEVNIRPPGGPTTDMFNFANDFDIYKEWANIVVNNRFEASWSRPYHVMFISRKNHLSYAYSHEEILRRWRHLICHHEQISPVFSRAMGNYYYLARSPYMEELLELANHTQKLIRYELPAA